MFRRVFRQKSTSAEFLSKTYVFERRILCTETKTSLPTSPRLGKPVHIGALRYPVTRRSENLIAAING